MAARSVTLGFGKNANKRTGEKEPRLDAEGEGIAFRVLADLFDDDDADDKASVEGASWLPAGYGENGNEKPEGEYDDVKCDMDGGDGERVAFYGMGHLPGDDLADLEASVEGGCWQEEEEINDIEADDIETPAWHVNDDGGETSSEILVRTGNTTIVSGTTRRKRKGDSKGRRTWRRGLYRDRIQP